ncbi:hypothetical protein BRC82_08700 [Halobacteriales archaeon QS_1_67_19]|nr:MAG: hypothetical protein BRC82_08700 [Halobacteriales archaeon QS_1_67_19]
MSEPLTVRLNSDRLHDISVSSAFEATDTFPILLENGDAPVHVHVHLDDALSDVATIPANNHFLDAGSTRRITVEVEDEPRPAEGRLKIVTGHGAETAYVSVSIAEPDEESPPVDVDADLAAPQTDAGTDEAGFELPGVSADENAPVVALGLLALAAAVSAATLSESLAVLLGALAVLGSLFAAGYLLVR